MKVAWRAALGAVMTLTIAATGHAMSFDVSGTLGQAEICTDTGCNSEIYSLGSSSDLTGSLTVDSGSYSLSLVLSSAQLTPLNGGGPLTLDGFTYDGSGSVSGAMFLSLSGTTDVAGSVTNGATSSVDAPGVGSSGSCIEIGAAGSLSCTLGLISGDLSFELAGTGTVYMSQTLDFVATPSDAPEPGAILLLLGSVGMLALRRSS